jgi:hypothetical protein
MTLPVFVGRGLLRRAPPMQEMRDRLAAFKWALVRDFSTALRQDVVVTDRAPPPRPLWRAIRRNLVSEVFHPSRAASSIDPLFKKKKNSRWIGG